ALAIFQDHEGSIWIGSEAHGLTILREQKFQTFSRSEGLSDQFTRVIYQTPAGEIWAGTSHGGLNHLVNGQFKQETTASLTSNTILALAAGRDGDLWVGTPDGLNRLGDGRVSRFTSNDGMPDDFVRSVYVDPSQVLWIGTRRGLSRYANGTFSNFSTVD